MCGIDYINQQVVYRTIPTSNHNLSVHASVFAIVVYRTIPTSNHNMRRYNKKDEKVVYRTIPTSNHNLQKQAKALNLLYIVLFLHQTTTGVAFEHSEECCISYYSYIKPQLPLNTAAFVRGCISYYSYIKPQPIMLI